MDADTLLREQFPELCKPDAGSLAEVISVDAPRRSGREINGATIQRELEQLERSLPATSPVRAVPPSTPERGTGSPSLIAQQREILGTEIRSIELALERERANTRQYYDYARAIELRMKALENQCTAASAQLAASMEKEASSNRIRAAQSSELARAKGELERFRRAWQEVLRRDEESRKAIHAWNAQAKRMQELEQQLRATHQQFVAERAKADLIETRAREAESRLGESERQAREQGSRAAAREREIAELQDLCRAHEQKIREMEAASAERLRDALESERRSSDEEIRIVRAQAEARVAGESDRIRAELEATLAEQKSRFEEKVSAVLREREMSQQTASSRIGALEELVSQDRLELSRLAEGRARIEQELRTREARVSALRSECEILQSVIVSEKSRFRQIADKITDELIKIEAIDEIDPVVLDELTEVSRLQTVNSAQAEPKLEC
jgi:hypothetical protein